MSEKFSQMDLSSEENMIFLGHDYVFETYEEILEFANSRNMMGKAKPFQKEYLEEGDFVIYKLYEMK